MPLLNESSMTLHPLSSIVMCWAGLKPEAEPGPARLSPGSGPGFQPIYITYVSSRRAARPDRPAARCVGIEHQFFFVLCRSCLVTGSHTARPYGPTLRPRCHLPSTEISLPKRLNRASLLPPPRTGPYDCAV